jgi:DNA gyrase/topoisomerase IV subunit A
MGMPAGGVMAIKLADGDEVVGALLVIAGAQAALVTRLGYGRRTPLAEFPAQKRHGGGVVACKVAQRTGPVAGVALIGGGEPLLLQTSQGRALTMPASDLPQMGRGAQGNIVTKLRKGEEVAGLASLSPEPIVGGKPRRAKKAVLKAEKPSAPAQKRAVEPAKKAKVAPVKKAAKTEPATKPKKVAPKTERAAKPAKAQKADGPAKVGQPPKAAATPKKGVKPAAAKTSQAPKPAPGAKKRASKPRPVAKPKPAAAAKSPAPAPKAQEVNAVAPVTQPKSKPVSPALPLKKKPSGAQKAGSDKVKKGVVRSVKK